MDAFLDFVVLHLSREQFVSLVTLLIMWAFIAVGVATWYAARWAF